MRPVAAFALGILAYCVFLPVHIPANVVTARVESATGGRVAFTRVEGGIFAGRAAAAITQPAGGAIAVDEVRWRFLPSRLLAGRLAFDVEGRMGALGMRAEAARTPRTWQLRDLHAEGDASALSALSPLLANWQPSGAIAIASDLLAFDDGAVSGTATAQWRDAALALSDVRPLGSWHATLSADGGPARLTLATTKGPLNLAGNGTLPIPGRLAFTGEARADAGREKDLEPLLKLLGNRRPDGAVAIELR
jgi:general secretion pathway protein N